MRTRKDQKFLIIGERETKCHDSYYSNKLHVYIFHLFFINIRKVEYHCMKMSLFELCLVCESFM